VRFAIALEEPNLLAADFYSDPDIVRRYRGSLAAALGLPLRNVVVTTVVDAASGESRNFTITDPVNSDNSGGGAAARRQRRQLAATTAAPGDRAGGGVERTGSRRLVAAAGIAVYNTLITSDLADATAGAAAAGTGDGTSASAGSGGSGEPVRISAADATAQLVASLHNSSAEGLLGAFLADIGPALGIQAGQVRFGGATNGNDTAGNGTAGGLVLATFVSAMAAMSASPSPAAAGAAGESGDATVLTSMVMLALGSAFAAVGVLAVGAAVYIMRHRRRANGGKASSVVAPAPPEAALVGPAQAAGTAGPVQASFSLPPQAALPGAVGQAVVAPLGDGHGVPEPTGNLASLRDTPPAGRHQLPSHKAGARPAPGLWPSYHQVGRPGAWANSVLAPGPAPPVASTDAPGRQHGPAGVASMVAAALVGAAVGAERRRAAAEGGWPRPVGDPPAAGGSSSLFTSVVPGSPARNATAILAADEARPEPYGSARPRVPGSAATGSAGGAGEPSVPSPGRSMQLTGGRSGWDGLEAELERVMAAALSGADRARGGRMLRYDDDDSSSYEGGVGPAWDRDRSTLPGAPLRSDEGRGARARSPPQQRQRRRSSVPDRSRGSGLRDVYYDYDDFDDLRKGDGRGGRGAGPAPARVTVAPPTPTTPRGYSPRRRRRSVPAAGPTYHLPARRRSVSRVSRERSTDAAVAALIAHARDGSRVPVTAARRPLPAEDATTYYRPGAALPAANGLASRPRLDLQAAGLAALAHGAVVPRRSPVPHMPRVSAREARAQPRDEEAPDDYGGQLASAHAYDDALDIAVARVLGDAFSDVGSGRRGGVPRRPARDLGAGSAAVAQLLRQLGPAWQPDHADAADPALPGALDSDEADEAHAAARELLAALGAAERRPSRHGDEYAARVGGGQGWGSDVGPLRQDQRARAAPAQGHRGQLPPRGARAGER
jgi:hypothetical protein